MAGWFKEEVEDWDMVGKSMARAEGASSVRFTEQTKFNPADVVVDMFGNATVQEAVDSTETFEMDDEVTIEVGSDGIGNLGLDTDVVKQIKGD